MVTKHTNKQTVKQTNKQTNKHRNRKVWNQVTAKTAAVKIETMHDLHNNCQWLKFMPPHLVLKVSQKNTWCKRTHQSINQSINQSTKWIGQVKETWKNILQEYWNNRSRSWKPQAPNPRIRKSRSAVRAFRRPNRQNGGHDRSRGGEPYYSKAARTRRYFLRPADPEKHIFSNVADSAQARPNDERPVAELLF